MRTALPWLAALGVALACGDGEPSPAPERPAPAATAAPASTPPARRSGPPNVVLILADDLGYGDLGVYGQQGIETPHLDALAAEGMRFTDFYAGSPICAPSRAVLLTGRHTGHTGIRANRLNNKRILPHEVTVAEVLKTRGYATGAFGKWGVGDDDTTYVPPRVSHPLRIATTGIPVRQGFDTFYGYLHPLRANSYFPEWLIRDQRPERTAPPGARARPYSHDLFTDAVIAFLEAHAGEPFFAYVPYQIPHSRLEIPPNEPSLALYRDRPWTEKERIYAAMVTRLDRDVGRIVAQIDALGLRENTLVLFTSDNGPHSVRMVHHSNAPLTGGKGTFYEGGLRVPLIVRWPGTVAGGAVTDQLGGFQDLLPTLADLAGASAAVPPDLDGVSLAPVLRGATVAHPPLYWEAPGGKAQAVRDGPWKMIRTPLGLELFDLSADETEALSLDLADSRPDVVERIGEIADRARSDSLPGPVTMVGHWPFDEGAGRRAGDTTGTSPAALQGFGRDAWVADAPGEPDGARFENPYALRFDGVDDVVATDYPGVGGSHPRTVTFWMKSTDTATRTVLSWGHSDVTGETAGGRWEISLADGRIVADAGGGRAVGTASLGDGHWHHVAVVFPGGDLAALRFYVDGRPDPVSELSPVRVDTLIWSDDDDYLRIGAGRSRSFSGLLDDVALFNLALDESGVRSVRENGALSFEPPLTLEIDPASGEAALANTTGADVGMAGYAIFSRRGWLRPEGWSPLGAGHGWARTTASTITLRENDPGMTGLRLGPGERISLGLPWAAGDGEDDLRMQVIAPDGTSRNVWIRSR